MGARHIPSQGPHPRCPRKSPLEAGLIHASILQGPVESAAPWPWRGGWGAVGTALLTRNPHSPSPQACKVTVTCPDLPRGRPGPGTSGRTGTCPQSHTRLVAGQRVEPWSLGIPQLLQLPPASLCALGSGDSRAERRLDSRCGLLHLLLESARGSLPFCPSLGLPAGFSVTPSWSRSFGLAWCFSEQSPCLLDSETVPSLSRMHPLSTGPPRGPATPHLLASLTCSPVC